MAKFHNLPQKKRNWQKRQEIVDLKGLGFRGLKPKNGKILTKFARIGFKTKKRSNLHWNCFKNLPHWPNMPKMIKFCKLKGFRV